MVCSAPGESVFENLLPGGKIVVLLCWGLSDVMVRQALAFWIVAGANGKAPPATPNGAVVIFDMGHPVDQAVVQRDSTQPATKSDGQATQRSDRRTGGGNFPSEHSL